MMKELKRLIHFIKVNTAILRLLRFTSYDWQALEWLRSFCFETQVASVAGIPLMQRAIILPMNNKLKIQSHHCVVQKSFACVKYL